MKILFLSAEVAPYVAVGGLSQVMYFLPRALKKRGHDVRIFTPRYAGMDNPSPGKTRWKLETDLNSLKVPTANDNFSLKDLTRPSGKEENQEDALKYGGAAPRSAEDQPAIAEQIDCRVMSLRGERDLPTAYFLENREFYGLRANVYGYTDDHIRFSLLCKGCLEWLLEQEKLMKKGRRNAWLPDVIHCHDWHASYLIDLARRDRRYAKTLAATPIVLTVHNFKPQGNMNFRHLPDEGKDLGWEPLAPLNSPTLKKQNALKRGLLFADAITTVSPTHALEALTPEYAEGLEGVMAQVRGKFSGILNGLDVAEFNPATDHMIHRRFDRRWFKNERLENKLHLQRLYSLEPGARKPIFAYVGRLNQQKGLDLILESLPRLLERQKNAQFVMVGSGDERYHVGLEELAARFPGRVGLHLRSDFELPRKIFSGTDVVLMPSLFEPGGIVALEALRYGAVPLVRRTGGLNDSVEDFDPNKRTGNGFSFRKNDVWELYGAMIEALSIYRQTDLWSKLVANCLACDFSWQHAASEYDEWYRGAAQERRLSLLKPYSFEE